MCFSLNLIFLSTPLFYISLISLLIAICVGSKHKEEDKIDSILDQLLSYNCEDLEGDQAVSLLQEHLQLKPIELEKLRLPDFQDLPKIDLKSSRSGKLPKRSHVLSDIDNMLKGLSGKTHMQHRQVSESSVYHFTSSTPPKSPLASLSVLNQRLLRSNSSNDPFSAHDISQFPDKNPFSVERNKEFDSVNVAGQSEMESPSFEKDDNIEVAKRRSEMESPLFENDDNTEVAKTASPETAIGDFNHTYEKSGNDDTSKLDGVIDVGSIASHVPVDDNTMDSNMDNRVLNEKLCGVDADGDAQAHVANVEDKVSYLLLVYI